MKDAFVRATNLLLLVLALLPQYAGGSGPYSGVPRGGSVAEVAIPSLLPEHEATPWLHPAAAIPDVPELLPSESTEEQKEDSSPSGEALVSPFPEQCAGCWARGARADFSSLRTVPKRYLLYQALRIAC